MTSASATSAHATRARLTLHLLVVAGSLALACVCSLHSSCCGHGLSPADKSQHSVTCEECWDLRAGSVLLSVLYRGVPKVLTLHGSVTLDDADCTELMCTSAVVRTRDSYGYGSYR